jgi:nitrogen fixation-related uncharacterized protein
VSRLERAIAKTLGAILTAGVIGGVALLWDMRSEQVEAKAWRASTEVTMARIIELTEKQLDDHEARLRAVEDKVR